MQGPTGSQTKSCTFKGLRVQKMPEGGSSPRAEKPVTDCKYECYELVTAAATRRHPGLFPRWNPLDAHVRAKDFRDHDRSVSLLVVLHHGNPSAAHSES